jgi:hypothetical protein
MVPPFRGAAGTQGAVHNAERNNNTIAGRRVSRCGMDIKIVGNAPDDDIV